MYDIPEFLLPKEWQIARQQARLEQAKQEAKHHKERLKDCIPYFWNINQINQYRGDSNG